MLRALLIFSVPLSLVLNVLNANAQTQEVPAPPISNFKLPEAKAENGGPYTVCIGDVCQANVPGSANYIFRCDFARSNANDTDAAAAKTICNIYQNYTGVPTWVRYGYGGNGGCGYIFDLVRCH